MQISCLRAEQTQLSRSLEKERQRAAENRQEYLTLKEEADTHEGRANQLEEEIRELRRKHKQEIQDAMTKQELLQQVPHWVLLFVYDFCRFSCIKVGLHTCVIGNIGMWNGVYMNSYRGRGSSMFYRSCLVCNAGLGRGKAVLMERVYLLLIFRAIIVLANYHTTSHGTIV